jgi:hypothetical protein
MVTIQLENKGISFQSPYTHGQVAITFRELVEQGTITSSFGRSLYQQAKKKGTYSQGQLPWLHILVAQAEGRATRPAPREHLFATKYQAIHEHMLNCRQSREQGGKGLLNPVIGLQVADQRVVLKLAGKKSRNSGKVSVASSHRYGEGEFYGWIDQDGTFRARHNTPNEVFEILDRVAEDPARAISEIGKESGHCCYCFAELTTVPSKMAGCGSTCAANYGVHYPGRTEVREYVLNNPEILIGATDQDKWV